MVKKSEMTKDEMKKLMKKIVVRFSFLPIFLGLLVLLPAGTFDFWQLYIYFAILIVPMTFVLFYFLRNDPQFLERRMRAKEKEKQQRIIQIILSFIFFSGYIISGFDRRFGWSVMPMYIVIVADIIILLGYLIIFFVFKQNSYASRIVEVERNQTVITSGLYGMVRHPMYLGVLLMFIPAPVALDSFWGLIPMATIPLALVFRILNEEKVLCNGLSGYKEYCQKTKYRLIPFVW